MSFLFTEKYAFSNGPILAKNKVSFFFAEKFNIWPTLATKQSLNLCQKNIDFKNLLKLPKAQSLQPFFFPVNGDFHKRSIYPQEKSLTFWFKHNGF